MNTIVERSREKAVSPAKNNPVGLQVEESKPISFFAEGVEIEVVVHRKIILNLGTSETYIYCYITY